MAALTVSDNTVDNETFVGTTVYDPVTLGNQSTVIVSGAGVFVELIDVDANATVAVSVESSAELTISGTNINAFASFYIEDATLVLETNLISPASIIFNAPSAILKLFGAGLNVTAPVSGFETLNDQEIIIDGTIASFDYVPDSGNPTGSGTLTITAADSTTRTVLLQGNYTNASFTLDSMGNGGQGFIACFARGTRLSTPAGHLAVEDIQRGDVLLTHDGRQVAVKWVGHRAYTVAPGATMDAKVAPVTIRRDAFAAGQPSRDLHVSPEHAVFIDGVLIPARHLVNGCTVVQDFAATEIEYFHIELEQHDVVVADGLPCESWLDTGNRHMFHNVGLRRSQPVIDAATAWRDHACAPLIEGGWELDAIRLRLMDRALATGWAVSRDPDLAIIAGGCRVAVTRVDAQRFRFTLPAGAQSVVLASRAAIPAKIVPGSADERALGVVFGGLTLRCGAITRRIGADTATLTDGFHDLERSNTGCWRWTSGAARLPAACFAGLDGPITAELYIPAVSSYLAFEREAELMTA